MTQRLLVVLITITAFPSLGFAFIQAFMQVRMEHFCFMIIPSAAFLLFALLSALIKKYRLLYFCAVGEFFLCSMIDLICIFKANGTSYEKHVAELTTLIVFFVLTVILLYPAKKLSRHIHIERMRIVKKMTLETKASVRRAIIVYSVSAAVFYLLRALFGGTFNFGKMTLLEMLLIVSVPMLPLHLVFLSFAFAANQAIKSARSQKAEDEKQSDK